MIGLLSGKLFIINPGEIIVETGGVGYRVMISYNTYYEISSAETVENLMIHTYVREDSLTLYGFSSELEKSLFQMLISISGIGPKLAINILSGISPKEFINAVENASVGRLQAIPGVGKKTAERMTIEMRDKIAKLRKKQSVRVPEEPSQEGENKRSELVSALVNLGFKPKDAEKAVENAIFSENADASFEEILRKSLNILSGGVKK